MNRRRSWVFLIAVADAALVVAGGLVAIKRAGTGQDGASLVAGRDSSTESLAPMAVSAVEVRRRPWPQRVTADGTWVASLDGSGDRVDVRADGRGRAWRTPRSS